MEKEQKMIELICPVLSCANNIPFMAKLPDGMFKLIVTSPPYNLGKVYEDKSDINTYLSRQKLVIGECVRLLDERGSICWPNPWL